MKIKSLALHIFLVTYLITNQVVGQSTYQYQVERVLDGIYVLKPNINTYRWVTANIVVVINEQDVLIVDTGLLPSAAVEAIKEIKKLTSKPVRYIVNTHWHGDHWQGNEAFIKAYPGVEIISSEQTYKALTKNGMAWVNTYYPKYFQNYVVEYEIGVKEKSFNAKTLSEPELKELKEGLLQMKSDLDEIKTLQPAIPTMTFTEDLTLKKGTREINILYLGIGNTSGDAVVFLPKEKVLISGDLVVHPSPYESGMFSPEWLETSRKLESLDFNHLIPGHGEVQHDHEYLKFLNCLYEEIIKEVNEAYVGGTNRVDELKLKVTHKSVTDALNKETGFQKFIEKLEPDFVPAAVQTAYKRIIQGKQ